MSRAGASDEKYDKVPASHSLRNVVFLVVFGFVVALQLVLAEAYRVPAAAAAAATPVTSTAASASPTRATTPLVALPTQSPSSEEPRAVAEPLLASASGSPSEDAVDVNALEEQLRELDNLQQSLSNETTAVEDDAAPRPPPPPPLDAFAPPSNLGLASNAVVASSAAAVQLEHAEHHRHHTHSRHCKSRSALFKTSAILPALVAFPVLSRHHSASKIEAVWHRAFAKAGFTETDKPELATYLVSKQSLDSRLPYGESCSDTQLFNHIRGLRISIVDPIAVARTDTTAGVSLAAFWGSSSSRKTQCAPFITALAEQLQANVSSSDVLWAWTEKRDGTSKVLTRLGLKDLRKLVDAYKKSATCPHHDDVVISRRFRDVVALDDRPCVLRAMLLVASAKPFLAYLASRHVLLQCDDAALDVANAEPVRLADLAERLDVVAGPMWSEYRLPHAMRKAVAEQLKHSRPLLDPARGRFALLAVDFLLDRQTLRPLFLRAVDHPDLPDVPAVADVVYEAVRVMQVLLKGEWARRPTWHRPEVLAGVLDAFALVGFEPEAAAASADAAATTEASFYPF